MIVQACQNYMTDVAGESDNLVWDPAVYCERQDECGKDNKNIVLKRPDTILLLATVSGSMSILLALITPFYPRHS